MCLYGTGETHSSRHFLSSSITARGKNVQHLISPNLDFQLEDFQHVEEKRERVDRPSLLAVVFHRSDIHRLKKLKYFRHLQQSSPGSCSICPCVRGTYARQSAPLVFVKARLKL